MFPRNTIILFALICVCFVSCAKDDITPDTTPDKTIVVDPVVPVDEGPTTDTPPYDEPPTQSEDDETNQSDNG